MSAKIADSPTRSRALPVLYGAIGRVQAAVKIVFDIPAQLDTARAVGDLDISDVKREQIKGLTFELAAKAMEVTAALAELETTITAGEALR